MLRSLTGHTEAVTCIAFSPDSYHLLTGCGDGHCRIYCTSPCSQSPYYTLEDAHDLGVASSDFSPILHTQPNGIPGRYEVATCGHDCLVKVWSVDAIDKTITLVWRLTGHGGSVTCVRYSPQLAELIASTATDKTCRLWDPYSGVCLHILSNHEGILTCCAFSPDSTFLATGSMDKTVMIWDLPKDIGFQSFVDSQVKTKKNVVACWTTEDVNRWLEKNNLPPANINGSVLLDSPSDLILDQLNIGDLPTRNEMRAKLAALRRIDSNLDTPYELLCPITHHIMRDPVKCADGYTYERSAIESWFRRGHCTSPMTNIDLTTTHVEQNIRLQATIGAYLTALSQAK
ncbi:hypothetical protein AAG570_000328 [Ranatra chinensis]|uniref:U-box domain-containing protein n=1 Tax=Ranatra chinensis TaxID=642074 RepID=A0ABD0YWR3_9HEMI